MQEEQAEDYRKESGENAREFDGLLEESGGELPREDNPIAQVAELKNRSLLDLVMPDSKPVSEKKIELRETLSKRERNKGYGDFSDVENQPGTLSTLLFGEYLLEHFQTAVDGKAGGALDYELEYIYAGKGSDRENLKAVADKLMRMRFGANYIFLQGSSSKKAEAEAMAVTLCSLALVPELEKAAAQMILIAWAFGESIVDLRALLTGEKVPLVKSEESWQLSLSGLMKLGEGGEKSDGKDCENGLSYKEYLRILLFLEKKEKLGIRALDMIEQNLRTRHGLQFFKADQCICRMEIDSTLSLRRGIQYRFKTYYGYQS